MNKTRISVAMTVFVIVAASGAFAVTVPDDIAIGEYGTRMDTFLTRLQAFGFQGTVLAAAGGEVILHRAFGLADVPSGRPNRTSTQFCTGSVTKQFTAAAIMHLLDRGKLSVADPISKYFDDVPDDKQGITIHHLLTHTAGLQGQYGDDDESIPRDDFVRLVLSSPLAYPPGDHYEYSNAGYSLLAAIIEIVSRLDYEEYLQTYLFKPAGMEHTGLHLLHVPDSLIARSQNKELGYPSPAARPRDAWHLRGNGGILSTTADMYRWHLALSGNMLLSDSAREMMFTPHVPEGPEGRGYYGYGWVVQQSSRGTTVIWHNGGAMPHGWGCAMYRYVDDDAVFIVFTNSLIEGMLPMDDVVANLAGILFGRAVVFPPATTNIDPAVIEALTGHYTVERNVAFDVAAGERSLLLVPDGQRIYDLLFPSPEAARLVDCNRMTYEMVWALASGDTAGVIGHCDTTMATREKWATMLTTWWNSFDTLGMFKNVKIHGSQPADGAVTYCRINFAQGSVTCRFLWSADKCRGFAGGDVARPAKMLLPQSSSAFVGYNLRTGDSLSVTFLPEGIAEVKAGESTLQAKKE